LVRLIFMKSNPTTKSIKFILFFILIFFSSTELYAQFGFLKKGIKESKVPERGLVIVVGAGAAAVRSDHCGSLDCNDFGTNASVGALYKVRTNLSLGLNADYLRLGASSVGTGSTDNIAFSSEVIALTGNINYNLMDSYAGFRSYRSARKRFIVPYIKVGAGGIFYSATSFPADRKLDDSQTTYDPERQYPAFALVVPIGAGLRFRFSDEVAIAPELLYHITTSDHLDNGSPLQVNNNRSDHYGLFSVKLMYTPLIKNNIFSRAR
jgi:hypothetical protein